MNSVQAFIILSLYATTLSVQPPPYPLSLSFLIFLEMKTDTWMGHTSVE